MQKQTKILFHAVVMLATIILWSMPIADTAGAANSATDGDFVSAKMMKSPHNGMMAEEATLAKGADIPEEVKKIVKKYYADEYEISQWVLKPWIIADLNGDGAQELAVLIHDKRQPLNSSNGYPTHIAIFGSLEKIITSDGIRSNLLVKIKEGTPARNRDSFRLNDNAPYLKLLGCPQPIAIELYEEAATSFFLCWDGKNYKFFRDPTDEP